MRYPYKLTALLAAAMTLCVSRAPCQDAAPRPPTTKIPEGAIFIRLPDIQQPDDYSCGAAATMSILAYYGVGPEDYRKLKQKLGTTKKNGTDYQRIVKYVNRLTAHTGLSVKAEAGMSPAQLDAHLKAGRPVICSIQAYDDESPVEKRAEIYKTKNDNGHYVVAIGYDDNNYYFMDPSLTGRRGFLPRAEFVERWHDNEGTQDDEKIIHHLGLVFSKKDPNPVYAERARRID